MSDNPPDRRSLLRHEASDLFNASTAIASPTFQQRHAYHRMTSQGSVDFTNDSAAIFSADETGQDLGLGISGTVRSVNRVPVGSRKSVASSPASPSKAFTPTSSKQSPMSPQTPTSSRAFLSPAPAWQRYDNGEHTYRGGLDPMDEMDELDIAKGKANFNANEDNGYPEYLRPRNSTNDDGNDNKILLDACPTNHDIHSSRKSWISISVLILSIFSTIFSGIWLMLAIVQPRYGRTIHSGGSLTPSTASTLFALFAKTIELSFVTVFVTFLGQVVSRRSFVKASRGVTIPELTMRTWVVQPGFMITHWQHIQHAGLTVLGVITLTAAVMATFYTTASDALVSPHLKYGKWESKILQGLVRTSYANVAFIENSCQTPITDALDADNNNALTCLNIEHAGQAYHNYLAFLATWADIAVGGEGASLELASRPPPVGMLYDNTTVVGSWILTDTSDVVQAQQQYHRIINNVTMSMPHAGVVSAAHDPINGILQPQDLEGLGEYSIRASVVSPSMNVLCANLNATELKPMINSSSVVGTALDGVFNWNYTAPTPSLPPTFPLIPENFNSIVNHSVPSTDSIYILFNTSNTQTIPMYTMCQLRSFSNTNCSTHYKVSGTSQGDLVSNCGDPNDPDAYSRSVTDPSILNSTLKSNDWKDVVGQWALSTSLNDGVANANSSTARLLSQFAIKPPSWGNVTLPPLLPSLAEALAVMAGSTLLQSSQWATYYHFWNYTATILDPGTHLPFNASLASQQYTSGVLQKWQSMFYVVLTFVFACNVFCLVYFFLRSGLVTDYTEPQNLFALAVNSPPSEHLRGSCGGGPERDQSNVPWRVKHEDGNNHFYIQEDTIEPSQYNLRRRRERHHLKSMSSYSKLSNKRKSFL